MAKQGALSALGKGGMSELWARLRFLFLAIIVYRIGAHIPVPVSTRTDSRTCFDRMRGPFLACSTCFPAVRWSG